MGKFRPPSLSACADDSDFEGLCHLVSGSSLRNCGRLTVPYLSDAQVPIGALIWRRLSHVSTLVIFRWLMSPMAGVHLLQLAIAGRCTFL
jgi:hypothetical protein